MNIVSLYVCDTITDDLYIISSIDTLVQINEIVLEIVFHCNFVHTCFVWFCKRWGLMLCSVHLLSIELNLYIKHLTQLVHFRVRVQTYVIWKVFVWKQKPPFVLRQTPRDSRQTQHPQTVKDSTWTLPDSMWQKHPMCTAAYYP